ncbi:MAG: nitroreductase family protein [Lachnospiraceae bacterium]|nr:nitroreductase family protein [Lachnospiraceae bacterium]
MEFQEVIKARQSVRSFNGEPVSAEVVEEMVLAAMEAPSWKNSQTSRYYCVTSENMVERVRSEVLPGFNQNSTAKAPAFIVTTFKKNISGFNKNTGEPDNEVGNGWGAYDLGLHDMLLIAKGKELGVDTLIMGLRDEKVLTELLSIPEDEQIMSVIAVGYATEGISAKPKRKSVDEIARFF